MKRGSLIFLLVAGLGLGWVPAAWAGAEEGVEVRFHGYGEMHYNNPETGSRVPDADDPAVMDFHRLVLGWSVGFSDRLRFETEIDFEHAATELELEFAYLEFDASPGIHLRAGSVLMPVGPLNEFHEPTLFYSVERPYLQSYIIPTTWQEGGVGIAGSHPTGLRYRLYYVTGLDAEGFSGSKGLRDGRVALTEDRKVAEKMALVGRLEYVGLPGIRVGGSYYAGGADQKKAIPDLDNGGPGIATAMPGVDVSIMEADLLLKFMGFEFRGMHAVVKVDGAGDLAAALAAAGAGDPEVGERMVGSNLEAAYHLLPLFLERSEQDLVVFGRWERFNTQARVPSGLTADDANDRRIITYGLAYFPHPNVVLKLDQERWKDKADNQEKRLNVGMAFMF